MGKKSQMIFRFDKEAKNYLKGLEEKLPEARERAVEAAGMVWADEAKMIARDERHFVTGLYVNSIGYKTNFTAPQGSSIGEPIHLLAVEGTRTTLSIGSSVSYAGSLEKRFNIMGRALDSSKERMEQVVLVQIENTLLG